MGSENTDPDPQDQAEVFDETHLDDDGQGDVDFEDMDPVMDFTRDHLSGERPERVLSKAEEDAAERQSQIEIQADALLGEVHLHEADDDGEGERVADSSAPDEIELVYTGLMRNQRGAQASAAHWEAKRLSEDDINELGYGPESEVGDER